MIEIMNNKRVEKVIINHLTKIQKIIVDTTPFIESIASIISTYIFPDEENIQTMLIQKFFPLKIVQNSSQRSLLRCENITNYYKSCIIKI